MALLNCPFCDGESEMKVTNHIPSGYDYTPRCKDPSCCGRLTKKYSTRELAEAKWNMRAPVISDEEFWEDVK